MTSTDFTDVKWRGLETCWIPGKGRDGSSVMMVSKAARIPPTFSTHGQEIAA